MGRCDGEVGDVAGDGRQVGFSAYRDWVEGKKTFGVFAERSAVFMTCEVFFLLEYVLIMDLAFNFFTKHNICLQIDMKNFCHRI